MDFDAMSNSYYSAKNGRTYEDLLKENAHLKVSLINMENLQTRMTKLLQETLDSVLRLARESKVDEQPSSE